MVETTFNITASDGKQIFVVKNAAEKPNGKAVVIVHGLTGHPYEYQNKYMADGLCAKGYDVYRIALYWENEGCRKLHECTLKIHASDLNELIEKKCDNYKKLFVTGHSYGGPTVMINNNPKITAASLWDPSFAIDECGLWDDCLVYIDEKPLLDWNVQSRANEEMIKEGKLYTKSKCLELAENCNFQVQVIHAGDGMYVKQKYSYHSKGDARNRREIIEGTEHCFYEGNTCKELLEKTYNWFEEF